MPVLTIQLPIKTSYHESNRRRWEELLLDDELSKFRGRIETNRYGQVLMMPPASGKNSIRQSRILRKISELMSGEALAECPISTVNGVRAADVGWYSEERFSKIEEQLVFEIAPEICVEVVSPSNSKEEMAEKMELYFEAGAEEVWVCDGGGNLEFFLKDSPSLPNSCSEICPDFPALLS